MVKFLYVQLNFLKPLYKACMDFRLSIILFFVLTLCFAGSLNRPPSTLPLNNKRNN